MRKLLYTTIKQALLAMKYTNNVPIIKHVDIWNQQTVLPEEEKPFLAPAVFIEFSTIQWRPLAHAVREAEVQIILHIVTDSRNSDWEDAVDVFELLDDINAQLHCLHTTVGKRTMDSLTLVQSQTDHDFDELQDNVETYSCHVTDASAYGITYIPSQGVSLEVETTVQE